MTKAKFQLTHRAALDLRDIYDSSVERWGEKTARGYIEKLYAALSDLKSDDDRARQRKERALPFRIGPAEKHFIVYEVIDKISIVITLLYQRRDIESIIRGFTPEFLAEVEDLKKL